MHCEATGDATNADRVENVNETDGHLPVADWSNPSAELADWEKLAEDIFKDMDLFLVNQTWEWQDFSPDTVAVEVEDQQAS